MSIPWRMLGRHFPAMPGAVPGPTGAGTVYPLTWSRAAMVAIEWGWKTVTLAASGTVTIGGTVVAFDSSAVGPISSTPDLVSDWSALVQEPLGTAIPRDWEPFGTQSISFTRPALFGGGVTDLLLTYQASFQDLYFLTPYTDTLADTFTKALTINIAATFYDSAEQQQTVAASTDAASSGFSPSGNVTAFGRTAPYYIFADPSLSMTLAACTLTQTALNPEPAAID